MGQVHRPPGVQRSLARLRPRQAAGLDQQQPRRRGGAGALRAAQHPQVQRDPVRRGDAGRQRDDRPQRAAPQQVGADPAPGAAGRGGRRHQHHDRSALAGVGERVLHPGEFGLRAWRQAVLPAGVVGELLVAPVALVERRVAQHDVGAGRVRRTVEGVRPEGVAGPHVDPAATWPRPVGGDRSGPRAVRGLRAVRAVRALRLGGVLGEGEAEVGEGGELGVGVLAAEAGVRTDAARRVEQPTETAGRIEDLGRGAAQLGHQRGRFGRREGVLAGDGVQVAAEQEAEGAGGAELLGQLQAGGQQRVLGRAGVGAEGERRAQADQRGGGAERVLLDLLPGAFTQGHLGELALGAQPPLDLGEVEGRAAGGAADGLGEVRVAPPPVAHRGRAHAGQPGDGRGRDLGGRVLGSGLALLGHRGASVRDPPVDPRRSYTRRPDFTLHTRGAC